eukprot:SAG31_NODE_791_length_12069_cov_22.664411_2_plen_344_part_00
MLLMMRLLLPAAAAVAAAPIRSGQGDFVYEYQPQLLSVPPSPLSGGVNVLNGHAVTTDSKGNIYLTFQPANLAADTQCLARWKPDGTGGELLGEKGPAGLSQGVPHGLELEADDADGLDYLYHANNEALLFKTTTDGAIIWTKNLSEWRTTKPHFWPCKPTDATVVGDLLYVADGYGTSWIHIFDKRNGTYVSSFGGGGKTSADPVKFRTPHSLSMDHRFPGQLLVTDRSNKRLVMVDHLGHFKSELDMTTGGLPAPGSNALPCSSHYMNDPKAGVVALISSLGCDHDGAACGEVPPSTNFTNTGSVGIWDRNNKLISEVEVARYLSAEGHQHPCAIQVALTI